MKRIFGIAFLIISMLFILNAIFGRYIVLPGYLSSLGTNLTNESIPSSIPIQKILRYLLWAFSFKFGVYFFIVGVLFFKNGSITERILFSTAGIIYIGIAYMDWPFNHSLYFGIGGGLITITSLFFLWFMGNENSEPIKYKRLFEYLGFFFLIMAAYNLCPFCGVKCFALNPDKMIAYNLQNDAISFANHILSELVLGFSCIFVSKFKKKISNI